MSVRASHLQNAADGWIPNNATFSWTPDRLIAPFGFLCRCTVDRKLSEPTVDEKLMIRFDQINLPWMERPEKETLLEHANTLQKAMPFLPDMKSIEWFKDDNPNIMAKYLNQKNVIQLNERSIELYGMDGILWTLAHEYGHVFYQYLRSNPLWTTRWYQNKTLHKAIAELSTTILEKELTNKNTVYDYPVWIIFDKNAEIFYTGVKNQLQRKMLASEEVFTESMRFYFNGQSAYLDPDMLEALNFITGMNTIKKSYMVPWERKLQFADQEFTKEVLNWMVDLHNELEADKKKGIYPPTIQEIVASVERKDL